MIYDYKSDEIVQDIITECLCPILEDLDDEYSTLHRDESLVIYAPSYIAREIWGRLLEEIESTYVDEDSCSELLYDDNNEVLITLACDGMLIVEEARGINGKLKTSDASLSYVYDTFSKNDIDWLSSNGESILVFGLEDDCYGKNDCSDETDPLENHIEYSKDDDDMHGFTVSRSNGDSYYSMSFYSTDKLSASDIQSLLHEAGF